MIPILYPENEINFDNNGIGGLPECSHAQVDEEINGAYEALIRIPITAKYYDQIRLRCIIMLEPGAGRAPQPFRIYRITKPINGIVSIYAYHVAYDLAGIVASPFEAPTADLALQGLAGAATTQNPFTFSTDKSTSAAFNLNHPDSIWHILSGMRGSILDTFGGEYAFDRFHVQLLNRRGQDHGASIRYGKNMIDLQQDANIQAMYTGVYPYWIDAEGENLIMLEPPIIEAEGNFDFTRILPLNLAEEFIMQPTLEQLEQRARRYIAENDIGSPKISWTIAFESLAQSGEYSSIEALERVELGDTVRVYFEKLGVEASARIVKSSYDALREKYISISVGRVKSNIADTIASQMQEIERKPGRELTQQITEQLAAAMMGTNGGAVRLIDSNADGYPDELYIADDPDPMLARRVWRFNYNGWAASDNGYSGDFIMGATLEDGLLARAVTAADLRAGTIRSADGSTFYLDLNNGILNMDANSISLNGENIGDVIGISRDEQGRPVLRLGAAGSGIMLRLVNDRIAFYDANGTVLAYFSNNAFEITSLQRFRLGGLALQVQPNGSISFVPA